MKKWEEFFYNHKDCIVYGHEDMVHFTTEELYQAIKDRLLNELYVYIPNNTGFQGKLKES